MPTQKLSEQQSREIAYALTKVAQSLAEFRIAHWENLSTRKRGQISNLEWPFRNNADDILSYPICLSSNNLDTTVADISKAAKGLEEAIQRLQNVQDVFVLATKGLSLLTSVMLGDEDAIQESLDEVIAMIQSMEN